MEKMKVCVLSKIARLIERKDTSYLDIMDFSSDYILLQTILDNRYTNEALNLMLVLFGVKRGCLFLLKSFDASTRTRLEAVLQKYRAPYDLLVEGMNGGIEYFVGRPGTGPVFARTISEEHGLTGRFLGYPVVYENLATISRKKTDRYEIRYVHVTGISKDEPNKSIIIFQFVCGRTDFNDVLLDQLVAWRGRMITVLQEKGIFDPANDGIELQLIYHPKE